MKNTVKAEFPGFSEGFEGKLKFMYLDVKGFRALAVVPTQLLGSALKL